MPVEPPESNLNPNAEVFIPAAVIAMPSNTPQNEIEADDSYLDFYDQPPLQLEQGSDCEDNVADDLVSEPGGDHIPADSDYD